VSTRCNVCVQYGSTSLYLYKHHDGYPEGTGRLLAELLTAHTTPHAFIVAALAYRFADQPHTMVFEITNSWHGDIEYAYRISFDPAGAYVKVGFTRCQGPPIGKFKLGAVSTFAKRCNQGEVCS
jgi:hypothetical protein